MSLYLLPSHARSGGTSLSTHLRKRSKGPYCPSTHLAAGESMVGCCARSTHTARIPSKLTPCGHKVLALCNSGRIRSQLAVHAHVYGIAELKLHRKEGGQGKKGGKGKQKNGQGKPSTQDPASEKPNAGPNSQKNEKSTKKEQKDFSQLTKYWESYKDAYQGVSWDETNKHKEME